MLPRSEHATVVMGKKIIIIGGMGAHFVRDDICIVDTGIHFVSLSLCLSLSLFYTHVLIKVWWSVGPQRARHGKKWDKSAVER